MRAGLDKSFAQLYHDLDIGFHAINFVIPNCRCRATSSATGAEEDEPFYQDIVAKRRAEGGQR